MAQNIQDEYSNRFKKEHDSVLIQIMQNQNDYDPLAVLAAEEELKNRGKSDLPSFVTPKIETLKKQTAFKFKPVSYYFEKIEYFTIPIEIENNTFSIEESNSSDRKRILIWNIITAVYIGIMTLDFVSEMNSLLALNVVSYSLQSIVAILFFLIVSIVKLAGPLLFFLRLRIGYALFLTSIILNLTKMITILYGLVESAITTTKVMDEKLPFITFFIAIFSVIYALLLYYYLNDHLLSRMEGVIRISKKYLAIFAIILLPLQYWNGDVMSLISSMSNENNLIEERELMEEEMEIAE
jgi:hypothetical protein